MENSRCPDCGASIRGALIWKVKRGPRIGVLQSNVFECPRCKAKLLTLPNWLQFIGVVIAGLSILVRLYLEHAVGYMGMSLTLSVIAFIGFLIGPIALVYFPRYRKLKLSNPSDSSDAGKI